MLGPIVYLGELIELAQNQWYRVWRISQIKCLCQKSLSCTAKEVILSCPPISNKNERCPQHQKTSMIHFVMPRSVFLFTVKDYSNSEASNPVSQKVSCPDCEGKLFDLRAIWRKYNVQCVSFNICVCACVYVCVYIYIYIYICMYTHIWAKFRYNIFIMGKT